MNINGNGNGNKEGGPEILTVKGIRYYREDFAQHQFGGESVGSSVAQAYRTLAPHVGPQNEIEFALNELRHTGRIDANLEQQIRQGIYTNIDRQQIMEQTAGLAKVFQKATGYRLEVRKPNTWNRLTGAITRGVNQGRR